MKMIEDYKNISELQYFNRSLLNNKEIYNGINGIFQNYNVLNDLCWKLFWRKYTCFYFSNTDIHEDTQIT